MSSPRMPVFGRLLTLTLTLAAVAFSAVQAPQQPQQQEKAPSKEVGAPKLPGKDEPIVAAPVDPNSYKLGVEDQINIRVWRENDLTGSVIVRPDGKITVPLAGEMQAAGLTPNELSNHIAEALGKFLNKPEVIVSVISVQSKRYYLSGNVNRTGAVPLVTPTTILQALSNAGLGQWAKKSKIIIMRGTERIKFNYDEVIKGKKLDQNIFLQDGDHIWVP